MSRYLFVTVALTVPLCCGQNTPLAENASIFLGTPKMNVAGEGAEIKIFKKSGGGCLKNGSVSPNRHRIRR